MYFLKFNICENIYKYSANYSKTFNIVITISLVERIRLQIVYTKFFSIMKIIIKMKI